MGGRWGDGDWQVIQWTKALVAKLDELSLHPRAQPALWKERATFRELASDSTYALWRAPEYTHAHTRTHILSSKLVAFPVELALTFCE